MYWKFKPEVEILQEGPELLPQLLYCGMNMPAERLMNHRRKDRCEKAMDMCLRQRAVEMTERCGRWLVGEGGVCDGGGIGKI